ncbi:hypothetical protein CRG98_012619 [Punica granatum]|uniref:Uncharacterized protein n=1 Tax=Punica granatum TaxID=22663 RepID=A0A2I0KEL9_PUNGR|nr:hypothetical protein CRG98_012619 [Punica granatum]
MCATVSHGLGVSTFPGDARRTPVRMSRHYLCTIRRLRAGELLGSRGNGTPSFAKALVFAEPESPSSGKGETSQFGPPRPVAGVDQFPGSFRVMQEPQKAKEPVDLLGSYLGKSSAS